MLSGLTRGQFGTAADDHGAGDGVQACRVWIDTPVWQVLRDLLLESGLPAANIDAAGFEAQDDAWLGQGYHVTTCLSEPEKASDHLADLVVQVGGFMWWDPVAQKQRFKVLAPLSPGESVAATLTDDNAIVEGSVKVTVLENLRETLHAVWYALRSAIAPDDEPSGFLRGQVYVDYDAESENELGERRAALVYSRWFFPPPTIPAWARLPATASAITATRPRTSNCWSTPRTRRSAKATWSTWSPPHWPASTARRNRPVAW